MNRNDVGACQNFFKAVRVNAELACPFLGQERVKYMNGHTECFCAARDFASDAAHSDDAERFSVKL